MALRLASPGISIKEVDLTRGGVDFTLNVVGGIAAPFRKGPVNEITRINNEKELVDTFGEPGVGTTDFHYEAWYGAAHYLSYGGKLDVVRVGGGDLNTANAASGQANLNSLRVDSYEDYVNNQADDTTWYFSARNPGHWAENVKVAVIDNAADQTITGVTTTNWAVGYGVTQTLTGVTVGVGTTAAATGMLKGIISNIGAGTIDVRVVSTVIAGTESLVDYQEGSQLEFKTGTGNLVGINSSSTANVGNRFTPAAGTISDWYTAQNILTSKDDGGSDIVTLPWKAVLNKPKTNNYVTKRNGANDALHIVLVDAGGGVTGDVGSVLEKHANLSKGKDVTQSGGRAIYYKDYIADNSDFIFAGASPVTGTDSYWDTEPLPSGFSGGFVAVTDNAGAWGQEAKKIRFSSIGNQVYTLTGGKDYTGIGLFDAPLGDLLNGYDKFADPVDSDIRFLLQGSAHKTKEEEQAKANKMIQIAEGRKDTVAVISPHRNATVNVASATDQLTNVLSFFSPITSSSYAVFDSGYQYVYDRFNKKFIYMPSSSDIAGLMVRTDRDQFPWFSPAGTARGGLNFTVKLAFNPGQDARDRLYAQRVNPIISQAGQGVILFGDKTALSYESAFDRINVRRLFIVVEKAVENAAKAALFELNDAGTRSNFINVVEPFLRDVKAKRGIQDFLLVCDETNNTPEAIDRNEFIADVYIKPARSINFIGLTFVATRTGVSFSEVVGTV